MLTEAGGTGSRPVNPRSWLPAAPTVVILVAATWLYAGYRYNVWPQPGFLEYVLALSGELQGDWYTGFPAPHWALDHGLAVLPNSAVPGSVAVLWVVGLAVLWGSFIGICRSLGASLGVATAAALVLIATNIGGFGVSETLNDFFYPNQLSFALGVLTLALMLRDRFGFAGTALGLAVLIHPGLGPLLVAALAPLVLLLGRENGEFDFRALGLFAVPLAVFGLPPLIQLMLESTSGGTLSEREQFEFLAIVRMPHHILYSAFPTYEYVRTGLWLVGLIGSLFVLRELREARALAVLLATMVLICGVGAIASANEGPVLLVTAQTSRLSALAVLLAAAALGAGLQRMIGSPWTVVLLLGVFLVSPPITDHLDAQPLGWASVSATEASLLVAALMGVALLGRTSWRDRAAGVAANPRPAAIFTAVAVTICAITLVHRTGQRPGTSAKEIALRDVGAAARDRTASGDLVLGSPTHDGLRAYSERPGVVQFGSIRRGEGDEEWRRRVLDLTRDPRVLDPGSFGTNVYARIRFMDHRYQRIIAASVDPVCRYGARMVVARPLQHAPTWLRLVYRNEYYGLYRVGRGVCA